MKYVCTGATLQCTMGTSCPKLMATPKNVSLTGKDQANVADYVSIKNVPSFGRCRSLGYPPTASATAANHGTLTPMPCVPGTCPKWQVIDKDSLICGEPALLEPATLQCMYGGTISIVNPGQKLEIKCEVVLCPTHLAINPQTGKQNEIYQERDAQRIENENNKIVEEDIGVISGGAAPIKSMQSSSMPFHGNKDRFEYILLDVLNPILNGTDSNVANTIERTARRYTSANLRNILNAISITVDISSTEILVVKNSRYTSTFGETAIDLKPITEVEKNQYRITYSLENMSDYLLYYRDDAEVGILVKSLPKNQKPTECMFRNAKDMKWFPLNNPNDEDVIISLDLEEGKDYYAIVYIEALYKRNYLFSDIRKIQ